MRPEQTLAGSVKTNRPERSCTCLRDAVGRSRQLPICSDRDAADFHTWTLLKGVAIAAMLGVGSKRPISGENDLARAEELTWTHSRSGSAGESFPRRLGTPLPAPLGEKRKAV